MSRRSNNVRIAKYQRQRGDAARIAREHAAAKQQAQETADSPAVEESVKEGPYDRLLRKLRENQSGSSRDEDQQE